MSEAAGRPRCAISMVRYSSGLRTRSQVWRAFQSWSALMWEALRRLFKLP